MLLECCDLSPYFSEDYIIVVPSFCCRSSRSDLSALSPTWFSSSDIPLSIFDIHVVSVLLNDVDLLLPNACFSSTHDGQFQLISGCVRNLNSLSENFLGDTDGIPIHHSGRIECPSVGSSHIKQFALGSVHRCGGCGVFCCFCLFPVGLFVFWLGPASDIVAKLSD